MRSWTHLERQRGGFGFLGGPGETQIETDRRLIGERIVKIKRELEGVKRTRGAAPRRRASACRIPVVALVGYTNAGKSTLFNALTKAEVLAKDLLFATLDPTMRGLKLPGRDARSSSPTRSASSPICRPNWSPPSAPRWKRCWRPTSIVHVRDAAHDETEAQKADVLKVLAELGVPETTGRSSRS